MGKGARVRRQRQAMLNAEMVERKGNIHWTYAKSSQQARFELEKAAGLWEEVRPGEWASVHRSNCTCFDVVVRK